MCGTLILGLVFSWPVLAQTGAAPFARVPGSHEDPATYRISLSKRSEHVVRVEAHFPATASMSRDVQLPVWNALYQVRDFAQYVRRVYAHTDSNWPLAVRALDKTTWHVDGDGAFTFEYEILADTPGPFDAQVNDEHAFLNLAEICVYLTGARDRMVVIKFVDFPSNWQIATSLEEFGPGFPSSKFSLLEKTFGAASYDQMADSPVEMGLFKEQRFRDTDTTWYRVVVDADPSDYDLAAVANMAHKIAITETEWMQDRVDSLTFGYTFIYHFPRRPAGGGMEHAYSTAIDSSADRVKANPLSLADVTAHEFFHLWNVKRIRPQSLEPVDYTKEQYTRALWFSEGVTSTVADFIRVRAGYLDEKGFLAELAADIRQLESRPARLTHSVEEASLDAWLEKYPAYELPERSISYYNKGEIVGMLLDLQMRESSSGKKSLRDLFHWMNEHYARQGKFFPDSAGVQKAAEAVTGASFGDFFARYVAGIDPIPYDKFFATVGLRLQRQTIVAADAGFHTVRHPGKPATVTYVAPGSEAERAGLRNGDTILEVNGRASEFLPETEISSMRVGDTVNLRVANAGGQRHIKFKVGARPVETYTLAEREDATPAQRSRRAAWIRGDSE
jgi:predicted metalloprotease with PDZ domain